MISRVAVDMWKKNVINAVDSDNWVVEDAWKKVACCVLYIGWSSPQLNWIELSNRVNKVGHQKFDLRRPWFTGKATTWLFENLHGQYSAVMQLQKWSPISIISRYQIITKCTFIEWHAISIHILNNNIGEETLSFLLVTNVTFSLFSLVTVIFYILICLFSIVFRGCICSKLVCYSSKTMHQLPHWWRIGQ